MTDIPDKAVDAALEAYLEHLGLWGAMQAALSAAAPFMGAVPAGPWSAPAAELAPSARQDALTLELGLARNALDTQLGHLFLMRKAVEAEDGKRQLLFRIDAMQRQIHDFLAGAAALAPVPATEAREGE